MGEVTLSLERYNTLYSFEMEVKNGGKIYVRRYLDHCSYDEYYTKDDIIAEFLTTNSKLIEQIHLEKQWRSEVEAELQKYGLKYPQPHPVDLEQVKKMSIWRFIKWRMK